MQILIGNIKDMTGHNIIFAALPGVGAALLSVYNFFKAQQGAVIQPSEIIQYGVWNTSRGKERKKMLFLPAIFNNMGIKPGMITNVKFEFDGKEIRIGRLVQLKLNPEGGAHNLSQQDFLDILPKFPISVPAKDGKVSIFECYDDGDIIELDKQMKCKVTVSFGNDKSNFVEFPFKLTSDNFKGASLKWLNP